MTDEQIIKALECCQITNCKDCVYCGCDEYRLCVENLLKDTLNLINRQQAEIEQLKTEKDNLIKTYAECQVEFLKEFTEKLKPILFHYYDSEIDNLAKEMGCGNDYI